MKNCVNCGAEIAEEEIICPICNKAADEPALPDDDAVQTADEETSGITADEVSEELPEEEIVSEGSAEEDAADESSEDNADNRRKSRWTGLTTVIVVVTALIILGLVGFVLYKDGTLQKWWDDIRPKTKSAFVMEDYSQIQILRSAVEVDDALVDDYAMSLVSGDLTDKAVLEYAASHSDCDATNVQELKEYAHDYIYSYYLHNEIMDYLKSITTVNAYDEEQEEQLIAYAAEELEYTATNYGTDVDTLASYSGYEDALAYETETAHEYMTIAMILDKVMQDKGLSYTEEELHADIEKYLDDSGYSAYYTIDEFYEMVGDTWVFLYENLTYKFNIAMEALEPNVVLIDEPAE